MKFIIITLAPLFLIISLVNAQNSIESKRYNNWYFGDNAGITFNTVPPLPLTDGVLQTTEGTSSISDKYGRFLSYSDGGTVWNLCHDTMANGFGLTGNPSSTQSALITPNVVDDNKYFVFTSSGQTGGSRTFAYSVIDKEGDNCRGEVMASAKNVILLQGDSTSEKITATKHANGVDYWVVTRVAVGRTYYAFLVSGGVVNSLPVVSYAGIDEGGGAGYIRINSRGDKIVSAFNTHPSGSLITGTGYVEIGDFDNSTGVVSNVKQLSKYKYLPFPWIPTLITHYGVEFSPNDSLVYIARNDSIIRFEVYDANPQSTYTPIGVGGGGLQLGPNGKIYVSDEAGGFFSLSVINNPNNKTNPNYVRNGQSTGTGRVRFGFINIFYYYTNEDTTLVPPIDDLPYAGLLDSVFIDTCLNQTIQLGIPQEICRSYIWTPSLGLDDDTLAEPTASKSGIYYVDVNYKCNYRDSITLWSLDTIIAMTNNDTSLCIGSSAILSTLNAPNYAWLPAIGLNDSTLQNPIASPMDTTTYIITAYYGKCTDQDTITVAVNSLPIVNLNPDTIICINDSIQLGGMTSGGTYQWQPSISLNDDTTLNPMVYPIITTEYILVITDTNNCINSDSIIINILNLPVVNINNDTIICKGNSVILSASGGGTYLWSPSSSLNDPTAPNPTATPNLGTKYLLLVSNQCGTDSATVTITTQSCKIYIPNAFSPNGDGFNDVFQIRGEGFRKFSLMIYDRWGNTVFESKSNATLNKAEEWRGLDNNKGVYVYRLVATMLDKQEIEMVGNITLIK